MRETTYPWRELIQSLLGCKAYADEKKQEKGEGVEVKRIRNIPLCHRDKRPCHSTSRTGYAGECFKRTEKRQYVHNLITRTYPGYVQERET